MADNMPVSYTHLDVYKRQVLSKICESLKTDIGDIVEYISVEAAEEQK